MANIQIKAMAAAALALLAGSFPVLGAPTYNPPKMSEVATIQSNSLLPFASPVTPEKVVGRMEMAITAYSSTPEQTDSTPFITASGTHVRNGIVATNVLPFGTRIRIPSVSGDKIFTVEDRMAERKRYQVDIWFPDYQSAKVFGAKFAEIEVLRND